MIQDMTVGSPSRILLGFSAPMILSGMFQQLYNVVDSVVAGKFAGVDALAAVGASYPITMLFIAVATGAGLGCSVVISQLFGAREYALMKTAISTSLLSMLVLSLVCTGAGWVFCDPLMRLMNTPGNIFSDSALYLRIYVWGLVFLFLYNIATAVFNGLGDSKTPLYFLVFSSLLNIALDLLFVAVFRMGVAGVAWATFIAQGISSLISVGVLLLRLKRTEAEGETRLFDGMLLLRMGRIALPSILQQSIVSIGQLCVQALINSFGSVVVAGYSSAIKVDSFFKMTLISMSNAVSSFTAQNIGARKYDRVNQGRRTGLVSMIIYGAVSFVLILFTGKALIGLFVDSSAGGADAAAVGAGYMMIVSAGYAVMAVLMIHNGILRGAGYMVGFTSATLLDLVIRVAFSYLLAGWTGSYEAIWWAIPLGWAVAAVLSVCFYQFGSWRPAAKQPESRV